MVAAMLSGFKASVQNELNAFFAHLVNQADLLRTVSAQAFSKARKNFSHTAFARLNARLIELLEAQQDSPRWQGLRVVAADASKVRLFLEDQTGRSLREATAFALYLPAQELTLAAQLYSPAVGERQMLFEHLDGLRADDLLVLDRGYPSRWLVAHLTQHKTAFCMRVDNSGFVAVRQFLRSGQDEAVVTIAAPNQADCTDYQCTRTSTSVRLVRVVTPNGQIQAVMTSLLDPVAYPAASFADLYHRRWRIEEAFKRLKLRLALENTSGLSWLAAQQDFGAKILADNLNALAATAATQENAVAVHYKPNRTYAFAHLKRCLPRWLLLAVPEVGSLLNVFAEIAKNLVQFKPDASKPRPVHPKPHRKHAYKSTT
jgi:hypothetical protein